MAKEYIERDAVFDHLAFCRMEDPVTKVERVTGVVRTKDILAIPAADVVEAPRWIPVTERLPELIPCNAGTAYSEAVIVWTDGKKAMIAVWDGIDFLCAADYWEAWGENITHWMPLPEPPEDGENTMDIS